MDELGVAVGEVNHQVYVPIFYQAEKTIPKTLRDTLLTENPQ